MTPASHRSVGADDMRVRLAIAVSALVVVPVIAQMDEHHHHDGAERLGTIAFPTSCTAEAQPAFTRAVALLHSFWFEEAEKAFRNVAAIDQQCGMAWWGVAMSNFHEVWSPPYTPAELARGVAAAEKAT